MTNQAEECSPTDNSLDCRFQFLRELPTTNLTASKIALCQLASPLGTSSDTDSLPEGMCTDFPNPAIIGKNGVLQEFCNAIQSQCSSDFSGSFSSCLSIFRSKLGFNDSSLFPSVTTPYPFQLFDFSLNQLACQRYYLSLGNSDSCTIALYGSEFCGDQCGFYCGLVTQHCGAEFQQSGLAAEDCLDQCRLLLIGVSSSYSDSPSGNQQMLTCKMRLLFRAIYNDEVSSVPEILLSLDKMAYCRAAVLMSGMSSCPI